jgi:muconolactone delta-isomerase
MKRFMVSVIEDIDPQLAAKLQPEENKIIGSWRAKGMIVSMFFRADGSGLFAIMQSESESIIMDHMKTLPFFPYMKIEIAEIRS